MGLLPLGIIAQPNNPPTPAPSRPPGTIVMPSKPPSAEMPEKGKLSYAIGMYFARNITNSIKRGEITVDNDTVIAAISDVLAGKTPRMTEKEITAVFEQLKAAKMAEKMAKDATAGAEAKAKGDAFLASFAKIPGVTTLPTGLEYKVITNGAGPMPKDTDSVTVAYRGTFVDGTEFDHGDNFTRPLKGVIPGWQQILPLMKVGSKWQVAIPSDLAYGSHGMPPKIPGNAALVFDIELKSISPGAPTLPPISPAPPGTFNAPPTPPSTPVVSGEIIKVPSAEGLKNGEKIEVIKAGQTNAVNTKTQ